MKLSSVEKSTLVESYEEFFYENEDHDGEHEHDNDNDNINCSDDVYDDDYK